MNNLFFYWGFPNVIPRAPKCPNSLMGVPPMGFEPNPSRPKKGTQVKVKAHPLTTNPNAAWTQIFRTQMAIRLALVTYPLLAPPHMTRFVCMSDTHLCLPQGYSVPFGDVFVHAGDFTKLGDVSEVKRFNAWLKTLPHKYKVVICGNHELSFDKANVIDYSGSSISPREKEKSKNGKVPPTSADEKNAPAEERKETEEGKEETVASSSSDTKNTQGEEKQVKENGHHEDVISTSDVKTLQNGETVDGSKENVPAVPADEKTEEEKEESKKGDDGNRENVPPAPSNVRTNQNGVAHENGGGARKNIRPPSDGAKNAQIDVRSLLTNCIYLEDSGVELFGIKIYGSPWQPEHRGWAFGAKRGEECLQKWDKIPDDTDVLVTHGPPLGHGDSLSNGNRVGCVELLATVQRRVQPRFHVFGHIHEDYGVTYDGTTIFINASTCNEDYLPTNWPIVFDYSARS